MKLLPRGRNLGVTLGVTANGKRAANVEVRLPMVKMMIKPDEPKYTCPFCGVNARPMQLGRSETNNQNFTIEFKTCASCDRQAIYLNKRFVTDPGSQYHPGTFGYTATLIHPDIARLPKPFPNSLANVVSDYKEACAVLAKSSKSAATLARRCLQTVLSAQGYAGGNLAHQIDSLLTEIDRTKHLPQSLQETVDAIRNFGNFAAHTITDQTSLQVIDVEPGEAEWTIDIVEQLLDHYYEQPAMRKSKLDKLNDKLQKAGKPPLKSKP